MKLIVITVLVWHSIFLFEVKNIGLADSGICKKVTQSTDFTELVNQQPWLSTMKLVVKPDMLFGKRGKSGLVALNLDIAQVKEFVKERLGVEVVQFCYRL